jgi:hypothetical protein
MNVSRLTGMTFMRYIRVEDTTFDKQHSRHSLIVMLESMSNF